MTFVAFAYSKELTFYPFVMTYALYVIAFCDDLAPIMPLFLLCYIASSPSNNPGMSEEGLFYGESGRTILHFAAFVVIALIIRITFDRNITWREY